MNKLFDVVYLNSKSSNNFDDYYFNITGIDVNSFNMSVINEALNNSNSLDSSFNLSGDGFAGYKVNYRAVKNTNTANKDELLNYIITEIDKVFLKLKKD